MTAILVRQDINKEKEFFDNQEMTDFQRLNKKLRETDERLKLTETKVKVMMEALKKVQKMLDTQNLINQDVLKEFKNYMPVRP